MICTVFIHYDYDERDGILPSGAPKGPPYCHALCVNINAENSTCDLFGEPIIKTTIGNDDRKVWVPCKRCRHNEMQGR